MIYFRPHDGRSLRYNANARHLNVLVVPLFPLWIIGAFCVKDIPISHIVALVGDSTYLPCDISTTHEGDSVHLVLWYREDLGTSVYSIDARNSEFRVAERWSDDNVFSNRAYFLLDKQPALLGVENTREEDAGIYRCRVDFQIGQTRNSKVNLTVIVPPQVITIVDENGVEQDTTVGPYMEGDNLRLFCDVRDGKPAPTVSWYRNDRFVTNRTTTLRNSVTRSEIVVQNLSRDDVHSMLTCNATNTNKSIPLSSSVRVDMKFSPLEVKIIDGNRPLSAGKKYDLVCTTSGSRPPAGVTWWRNGQRLVDSKETTSPDGNTTTSVLSFMATKADAGRHLTCQAENHGNRADRGRLGTPDTIHAGDADPARHLAESEHHTRGYGCLLRLPHTGRAAGVQGGIAASGQGTPSQHHAGHHNQQPEPGAAGSRSQKRRQLHVRGI